MKATVRIDFPETPANAALLRLKQMVEAVERVEVVVANELHREALDGWLNSSRAILRAAALKPDATGGAGEK